ncbi:MAG: hypothetical protein P8J30_04565 [Ilumatobacter sp.]|nr:hypothetical protein [Ilumatobacter sp.]
MTRGRLTQKRFIVFARWYFTPTGSTYTAVILAGLASALAGELRVAFIMLTTGLLILIPWKLSFQECARVNLGSKQDLLSEQTAQATGQITALKTKIADLESEVSAHAHKARGDALQALEVARGEWGMLLRAEREQFASQLREHRADK